MKLKSMKTIVTGVIFSIVSLFNIANATVITANLTVDNEYSVYLSTDDSTQGTLIMSDNNWYSTESFSANLTAGTDYFLHVAGVDVGWVAGFLGYFSLDTSDHVFSNGLSQLLTNTIDWNVSTTGWTNYVTSSDYGVNGVYPWGNRTTIDAGAEWIWSADNDSDNTVYFSTAITAVPAPSTMIIFGIALVGLASRRFKKQA